MNDGQNIAASREWFRRAGYGMMAHFGLYSILGGEWEGRRTPSYGEWAQSYFAIPNERYGALARAFNPALFDANEWIRLARDAGMRYFVFTSKHHDGFALYRSEVDRYNIADATPFGRDIVAELAEACYKYGVRFGLYYSQELDWHEPDGGGYDRRGGCSGVSWHNSWDFGGEEGKDFTRCFERKIKPQVEEIVTKYGPLCLLWFDVPHTISREQSLELSALVKKHQPACLINSRIGNGAYDYVSLGDNEIPESAPPAGMDPSAADANALGGYKYSPYGLYESACTLNDTWGFKYFDQNWKSAETIAKNRAHLNAMGVNYLVNVGPDALGRIPSFSRDILLRAAEL